MVGRIAVLISITLSLCYAAHHKDDPFLYKKFPTGFMWGTATASYQIEGAWNVSGKYPNISIQFFNILDYHCLLFYYIIICR